MSKRRLIQSRRLSAALPLRQVKAVAWPTVKRYHCKLFLEFCLKEITLFMSAPNPTPTYESLRAIWCELLGLDQVSDNESFFELGGRSIDTVRLVNRIQSAFGLEITVRTVFEAQTLAQLSEALQSLPAAPGRPRLAGGGRSG